MDERGPSVTAERVAIRRAAHQLRDKPLVFADPLALTILRPEVAARLREEVEAPERSPLSRYFRAFFAVRSRFAEDALDTAIRSEAGVRQYVILGAGFDTFAYRQTYPADMLHVFEVDHPSTQAAKRARLTEAGIAIPPTVTFVPMDFTRDTLGERLTAAGFDRASPAFVAWLGVVPYLTLDEIRATLRDIAALSPSTSIVFDYGVPAESLGPASRGIRDNLARRVADVGEPWKTFFDPADLLSELHAAGFTRADDFDAATLNARYFAGRDDGLRLAGSAHIATATV
jgi:methyltransferase (TIGR00027 family)